MESTQITHTSFKTKQSFEQSILIAGNVQNLLGIYGDLLVVDN